MSNLVTFSEHTSQQISARDQRLTVMVCAVCASYLIANLPAVGLRIINQNYVESPVLASVCDNIFGTQFTLNFVVYAASNEQYREAYLLFIQEVVFCSRGRWSQSSGRIHDAEMLNVERRRQTDDVGSSENPDQGVISTPLASN